MPALTLPHAVRDAGLFYLSLCLAFCNFSFSCRYSLSLSERCLPLMRPAPPWWWDRQRVIKVKSHLVRKLTSIRSILPRGRPHPICVPPCIPAVQYIPDSHPPSFIPTDLLPHHVNAPRLSSSPYSFLLSFLIFLYPVSVITFNLSSLTVLFCDSKQNFFTIFSVQTYLYMFSIVRIISY